MENEWQEWQSPEGGTGNEFDNAAIGALAHLYRGEVYRSTIWRQRLDTTTNWAIVTLGLALSISYADADASPLPLLLVSLLVIMLLILEARRYRYFNVWRARARWIESNFYAPLLFQSKTPEPGQWQDVLARDYLKPQYHIGFWRAMGRRLRRNYMWILSFQAIAYFGKIIIHPTSLSSMDELFERMAIGPISGEFMCTFGIIFHTAWISLALWTFWLDSHRHKDKDGVSGMG